MSSSGRISALILAAAFLGSAYLKAKHFLIDGSWHAIVPILRSTALTWGTVVLELCIAIAMLTRWRRWGAWGVLLFATISSGVLAYTRYVYQAPGCGCLGRVALSYEAHAGIAVCLFVLASIALWDPDSAYARARKGA